MSVMIERLEGMVNRYHEINEMMMSPEIVTDSRMLAKLGRWWKPIRNIKTV